MQAKETASGGKTESVPVPVTLMEFSAGHYPGLKPPPLILNEIFQLNHPELAAKARQVYATLPAGAESPVLFSVEFDDGGEKELIDVKVARRDSGVDYMYLCGWPRSKKYYDIGG